MNTSAKPAAHSELEIGHVLFMDVVGYSKLLNNEQREIQRLLNEIVRGTERFRAAETAGKLIRLPVGDGMALVFFDSPEAPVQCAMQVSEGLKAYPHFQLRMGIHSGPVTGLTDVNDQSNIAGAGINMAQRVMDCGDAGHILLSKRAADDLAQDGRWRPQLHELGECFVKHGLGLNVVNFYTPEVGNPQLPEKIKLTRKQQAAARLRRTTLLAGAAVVLAVLIGLFVYQRRPSSRASESWKSIAVLPLENLSDEKENAYFVDGIQDELLSNLAKIKDLKVISRTSVMQYKAGITRNLKEIARQLGVSNVVEGSVRRSGDHLRISVQLIDALADRHIWAQNYDRTVADSVALQGELATKIASEVGATLSPPEKARIEATPTKNTAAYDAYLRGRAVAGGWTTDFSPLEKAEQAYQEAVNLDPNFALAWVYLSAADSMLYWQGIDPTPARLAAAKNAMDRAVALDPNLPEIHLAIGYYRYYGLHDFKGALEEFQTAEKSLPNNVDVLLAIGFIQRRFVHWDEVVAVMRRAVELDPRNIQSAGVLANAYFSERRYSDAMAVFDRILAVEPSNIPGIWSKTYCFWAMGNVDAADQFLATVNAPLHLRAHQAFNKHQYAKAEDLFSKALNETGWLADNGLAEKRELFLDLGLVYRRIGNLDASKATYQRAVQEITQALSKIATDAQTSADELHSLLGIAYAGLGDAPHAISEGQKGMEMRPTSEDQLEGPSREEDMARIYAELGNADEAVLILKRWVHVPSDTGIAPALLRIDPIWDLIRNDPRFQELLVEKAP